MNDEVNVSILDEDFARQMTEWFEKDLAHSERITLQDTERYGYSARSIDPLLMYGYSSVGNRTGYSVTLWVRT